MVDPHLPQLHNDPAGTDSGERLWSQQLHQELADSIESVDIGDPTDAVADKHGPNNVAIGGISGSPSAYMGGVPIVCNRQEEALKDLLMMAISLEAEHWVNPLPAFDRDMTHALNETQRGIHSMQRVLSRPSEDNHSDLGRHPHEMKIIAHLHMIKTYVACNLEKMRPWPEIVLSTMPPDALAKWRLWVRRKAKVIGVILLPKIIHLAWLSLLVCKHTRWPPADQITMLAEFLPLLTQITSQMSSAYYKAQIPEFRDRLAELARATHVLSTYIQDGMGKPSPGHPSV
jgi:hypothetical protein